MEEIMYGRNSVKALLETKEKPNKILIAEGIEDKYFENKCRSNQIQFQIVTKNKLDQITKFAKHQGVLAYINKFQYTEMTNFLKKIKNSTNKNQLILVLDGIEDPQNLGAIIRSADAFGVEGIIIGSHNCVDVNPTVLKVSTGAYLYVPIIKVNNLTNAIINLKKEGFWIVSSDGSANTDFDSIDYKGKMVLVIGSEGFGISELLLKNSDFIVKIPMLGHVNSLNASVATACFLSMINHLNSK